MKSHQKSLEILFDEALELKSTDQILIVYDESFTPYLDSLIEVINRKKALTLYSFLPFKYQNFLIEQYNKSPKDAKNDLLPTALKGAIAESNIILNVLGNNLNTTNIRRAIVHEQRVNSCRLAHLPGINDDILKVIRKSNFRLTKELGELLAWALGETEYAEIITFDHKGGKYSLGLKLGGWNNEPLMSPGKLLPGTWGNAFPGEVFCCPIYSDVNGEICINGSLPNVVIEKKKEALLEFNQGKLIKWSSEDPRVLNFFNAQKQKARGKDPNWNTFAELGFGLNPEIKKLTGNPLFDEKMASTIHIAIGDNSGFGFNVKSDIHVDMVIKNPIVKLDERIIIADGKLEISTIEKWKKEIKIDSINPNKRSFRINGAKIFIDSNNKAFRKCTKAGRTGFIDCLDEVDHIIYNNIIDHFKQQKGIVNYKSLIINNDFTKKEELIKALEILLHYKIIEYT